MRMSCISHLHSASSDLEERDQVLVYEALSCAQVLVYEATAPMCVDTFKKTFFFYVSTHIGKALWRLY